MSDAQELNHQDIKKAEALAKDIGIPPQPKVVLEVLEETNKPEPSLTRIASLVEKDVSMLARVLRIANSPFFSKGKIDTALHAVQLLGLKNFYNIVLLCSLEEIVERSEVSLGSFWTHSQQVAQIAGLVAQRHSSSVDPYAYVAGLFHDCGVVLLMKRFNDYGQILEQVLQIVGKRTISDRFDLITNYEYERYSTNHSLMGYVMTRSWRLNRIITEAVLNHHNPVKDLSDPLLIKLCSILQISELLEQSLQYSNQEFSYTSTIWKERYGDALINLKLKEDDISNLRDQVQRLWQ